MCIIEDVNAGLMFMHNTKQCFQVYWTANRALFHTAQYIECVQFWLWHALYMYVQSGSEHINGSINFSWCYCCVQPRHILLMFHCLLHGALVEWGHLSVCGSPLEDADRPVCSRMALSFSSFSSPQVSYTSSISSTVPPSSSEMVSNAWKFNLLSPIHMQRWCGGKVCCHSSTSQQKRWEGMWEVNNLTIL